jgi:hypothetical protein
MRDPITQTEEVWLRRALTVIRFVRHPAFPGLVVMALLTIAGFVVVLVTWYGAAGTLFVAFQVPLLVSGGLGGLALIGVGLALVHIQVRRRDAALEQRMTGDVLDEIAMLMALAPRLRQLSRRK